MKTFLNITGWLLLAASLNVAHGETDNPNYDPELAARLGGDAYGMKMYTLVMLTTGENTTATAEESTAAFTGHMSNIRRLVDEGKLIVAGPLGQNDKGYRGIFIFTGGDVAETESLLATDPAIAAGLLGAEVYPWYGSAALSEYLEASDRIWEKKP